VAGTHACSSSCGLLARPVDVRAVLPCRVRHPFRVLIDARKERIDRTERLFPAVPPAEQDMREVGLSAVVGEAEPGGSASCPQRRVFRACCPQIPFPRPMGPSFLLRFELGQQTIGGQLWSGWGMGLGEPSP
jgi:hypothetical protein